MENLVFGSQNIELSFTGSYFVDPSYTQGIGKSFDINIKELKETPGVYALVDRETKEILKFGDSQDLAHRLSVQYISINNITNNKVRDYIKTNGIVDIYVKRCETQITDDGYGPTKVNGSGQLEKNLINDFKKIKGKKPILNSITR